MSDNPRVVMVARVSKDLEERLRGEYGAVALSELDAAGEQSVEVAVATAWGGVDAALMDRLPSLRAVVNFGVGYDATDVEEAARRGIVVSNTPDVLDDCVADTGVALVLDVMRGFSASDRFVRRGEWAGGRTYPLTRRVTGARVGILGLGRIGLAVARRLEGFEVRIGYHNRTRRTDVDYDFHADPVALAGASDVLVVVTPGGPGTRGLVGRQVLDALGPQGFLVNIARGSVVDEGALVTALDEGRVGGAGLDVFVDEPHVPEALLDRDDVVLLPHVASATVETRQAMAALVVDNLHGFLERGELRTPV